MLTTNVGSTTTYFVGNYYEVTGSVITKYYYAGSQRIAMRENGVLNYIFGDHLGSTSIITNTSGNLISEQKYKAWGEVRHSAGTNPSEYTYTGQYSYTDDFGLMYYGARWYDSSLGRFAQADSIIPSNIQGLDRYAYTFNNPIIYVDPDGHNPIIPFLIVGVIVAAPIVLSRFGLVPDVYGVMIASAVIMNQDADLLVTAGIAVQSGNPISMLTGDNAGWAQGGSEELNGQNPFSPSASVKIMNDRIYNAIDQCSQCNSAVDKLVIAALAQNGFDFSPSAIGKGFPITADGNIDWEKFLSVNGGNPSSSFAQIRQDVTGMNYDTQLMLKIYIQDLQLLVSMGYELPDWLTEKDIQYIVDNNYFYNSPNKNTKKTKEKYEAY